MVMVVSLTGVGEVSSEVGRHAVVPSLEGEVGVVEVAATSGVVQAVAGGQLARVEAEADQGVMRGYQVHRTQIL